MAAEDLMEAGVKQDTSTKVATIAHKPPETPRNRTVTGPPRCTQKRTIEAKIQSCASPFTTPSGTVQSIGLAFSPAQQKLSNQGLKEALSSTHSTGGCSFGESFDGNFSFHDVTGTSFEATQTASDPSSGKEIGSPPEVQGLTDRGACPTVPWIIDRPGRGLEVSKAARTVLSPLPSPVCVVLFYSECASGARRNEIVMRTLFPQHIPQAPSARQRDEGSTRTLNVSTIAEEGGDEDEESVVVRLWKKPVRVRTGSNKKVTVVVAEASPGPSTPEGLVLALSVLLCSHMVFTGEDKILEETHIHELRDVQALTRHVRTRGEEDEEDGLAFKQYFPRLTWLFQDFEGKMLDDQGNIISNECYLNKLLRVHGFSEDAEARNRIRTMLCAFFPQQDCLPLPPCAGRLRVGSDDLMPNELLHPGYVSQLRSLRQRVLGAPRIKDIQGVEIDGKMLSRLSEAYVASWGKAGIFAVQSSWTLVQRAKCGDALLKGVESYRSAAIEVARKCPCSDQALLEAHHEASRHARALFQTRALGDEKEAFREALEQRLQDLHRQLAVHNEASSRQVALELLDSLYRDAQEGTNGNYNSLQQFEETRERVTDEFESLTQGLSRYSCRLALLEFMQYKLTDLTRDIILSPMRDSKVSTPATPQRHSSINYSGGGQVFKTPPAMAGVWMDRGVLQSQPHHGVDCDFSFEISPVPKEEEEEPSADIVDEDGLATWRTASEKKAWIEEGPSSVRPHGPESPSPGRREADCSMDGHSNRADAAEVGRHVTTLLPLETGEDGGSSIHVRPEVLIVVLEQDREGSRAGEVVHGSPMQTQSQRQGQAGQDSEYQKNAHKGAGEVVCDCLDQSASKRCAQSPLFSSDSSGSYSSSRSSSPETAQRVAGADPAVCERVSMGNKSVAAWLNLSLTPLERQRYGLGEAGLVNIDEGELCVADDRLENAAGIHDAECDEALAHVDCDQMLFVAGDILRRCHHDSPSVAKLALRRVPVVVDSPAASKASESGNSTEKESKGSHVRDESPEADPSRGSKIWDEGDLVSAKAIPETATKSRGIFDLISMLSKALSPQVVRPTDPMQPNIVKSPHEEKASTPHVQHSDSSEKSCVASRRQTPDTTVGSSSGGRRKSNSVRVSGDRDELSKKGLLLINGREDCKPIRGQLFLDGEQLLVPDPAIALLRCRCLEIRTMPAPRPPGSPGDWTETVSVCVDCGKAIYQRDSLRIEGQKEEQGHQTHAVASAAGLARSEKLEMTVESAFRPPDIFV